jgi:nitrogen-specific signal transduction histidine kinase
MKRCLSFLLFLALFYNCRALSAYLNFVAIKAKIIQPFFTIKPTGEGTCLGLSLTYDMAVKGHGGKIDLDTKVGEFTEFIVSLPLNEN